MHYGERRSAFPVFVSVPCRPGHSAQTVSRRGPDGFIKGPPSLPDCGPFARPLGPSEKIDEANWTDQAEIAGVTNGCGRISCQAFSKDLIVRTICASSPLVRLPTPKLCGRAFPGNFQWGGILNREERLKSCRTVYCRMLRGWCSNISRRKSEVSRWV